MTAIVDMYPAVFRRKNRRELFLLVVAFMSFLMGLIMLMEVGGGCHTLGPHTYSHTDFNTDCNEGVNVRGRGLRIL